MVEFISSVCIFSGMEISTRPHKLAQVSVKMSWVSANCRFFAAFLKVTRPMVSALKIEFPNLPFWTENVQDVDLLIFMKNLHVTQGCH